MTEKELREIVAENLVYYRNLSGMTQAQLAEYLNYSDKSVSKWENADGMPDVYVLQRIAELYCIGISDIISKTKHKKIKFDFKSKVLMMLCALAAVWLAAAATFAMGYLISKNLEFSIAFAYAVPVSGIAMLILSSIWKKRIPASIGIALIIWGLVLALWITFSIYLPDVDNLWALIIIAVPLQILAILGDFLRGVLVKAKNAVVLSIEKAREKRESLKKDDKDKE